MNINLINRKFLVLFILSIHLVFGYVFTGSCFILSIFNRLLGYSTRDLERNDSFFVLDASSWSASKLRTGITSNCSGTYLIGGFGVLGTISSQLNEYFSRTYSGLPGHSMIYFSFSLWALDSWIKTTDSFSFKFDSTVFTGWSSFDYKNFSSSICGDSAVKDLPSTRIFGSVAHTASSLTFQLISKLSQESQKESLGIRDINLMFVNGIPALSTNSMCGKASITIGAPEECSCTEGKYLASGVCTACDPSCASCFGSGSNRCYECQIGYSFNGSSCFQCYSTCSDCNGTASNQCLACKSGYLLFRNNTCVAASACVSPLFQTGGSRFCESPCSVASQFLYWNSSCLSTCNSPLHQSTLLSSLVNTCVYPCATGQYLYWNGTCISNCNSPLKQRVEGGKNFCDYPCTTSQYLYWNGTCGASCPSPLTPKVQGGKNFCDYPCSTSQYLYWNSTCLSSCLSPLTLRTQGGKQFCDYKCPTTQYLYWNSTCGTSCLSPLLQTVEGGRNFCYYPCSTGQYLYWNGSCVSNCSFPLTQRIEGGKQFCDYKCTASQYLYWNSTCAANCSSPLLVRLEAGKNYCDYPCSNGQYLYWNSTCISNCSSPLKQRTEGGKQFCDYNCLINEYLYSNGTCSSNCSSPLLQKIEGNRNFCYYPCFTGQYLYWNGSCISNCSFPLTQRIEGDKQFCNYGCAASEYLYWNGTCSASCLSPLSQRNEGGKNFCDYPCASSEYLYWDSTCSSNCTTPLIPSTKQGRNFCGKPCLDNEYILLNGSCVSSCDPPLSQNSFHQITFCLLPCNKSFEYYYEETKECKSTCPWSSSFKRELYYSCSPFNDTSTLIFPIVRLLHYMRYIDTKLPPKLLRTVQSRGTNLLSVRFIPETLETIKENFPNLPLPAVFEKSDISSSFLVNFIDDLLLLCTILILDIFLGICQVLPIQNYLPRFHTFIKKLRVLTGWNLPLILLAISNGDIFFFSTLEFRTFNPTNQSSILSMCFCIVMLMVAVCFFIGTFFLVRGVQNAKDKGIKSPAYLSFIAKWHNFQVLYGGIQNEECLLDPYFVFIYSIRQTLQMLIASCLFDLPLAQALSYDFISVFMILYILLKKPVKKTLELVNLMLIEGIILMVNISVSVLVLFDVQRTQNQSAQEIMGNIIIAGNYVITLQAIIFLVLKVVRIIKITEHSVTKEKNQQKKSDLLQLLFVPFQQGAYGFENINMDNIPSASVQKVVPLTQLNKYMKDSINTNVDTSLVRDKSNKDTYRSLNQIGSIVLPSTKSLVLHPSGEAGSRDLDGTMMIPEVNTLGNENKTSKIISFISTGSNANIETPKVNVDSKSSRSNITDFFRERRRLIRETVLGHKKSEDV